MKGYYTRKFCLLCLVIFCCTTSLPAQCDPERPFENDKFSARPSPAKVTQESEDSLKQKGYFLIATVRVENNIETFWGDKTSEEEQRRSINARGQRDLTPKLLNIAASCGGDLVTLQKNNSLDYRGRTREGRCLSSRAETHWETSYIPSPHQVEVHRIICDTHKMVGGTQWYVHSVGSVWRLEPGLDRLVAERKEKDRILHTEHFRDHSGPLKLIKLYDKWGYEDESGSTVVPPQLEYAEPFVDGLAVVSIKGQWGYINTTGAFAVNPQFEHARTFAGGLAPVKINGKYGYIDTTGAIAVKPEFDSVSLVFVEGLAQAKINGKYGYLDKTGAFAVKPEFAEADEFAEGLARVTLDSKSPPKWGYINTKGEWAIQPQFVFADNFSEGVAAVGIAYDGEDEDKEHGARKYLFPPKARCGYIDKSGKWVVPAKYDEAKKFSEGLAAVAVGEWRKAPWGKALVRITYWGYTNKDGLLVIEAKFDNAFPFSEGMAAVEKNHKYGYINKAGEIVVKPQFEEAGSFNRGRALVTLSPGRLGFVDKSGQISEITNQNQ
jgi:hypothetical protein